MIDTHAHLMFPKFQSDLEDIFHRAKEAGVEKIINVGFDINSSRQAVEMMRERDFLYATLGLHPYDALDANENLMKEWEELILANEKIVAIGETGLDYFKARIDNEKQKRSFRMHLELAQKMNLPVIVHSRDSDEDCLDILKEFNGSDGKNRVGAVFHCFGSNLEFARRAWDAGYLTSFTGIITFPNAEVLREVVADVPMDKFMVETDCPYLAAQKYRGRRNEPAYVVEVAKRIAEIKGVELSEIDRIATENAVKFFRIK